MLPVVTATIYDLFSVKESILNVDFHNVVEGEIILVSRHMFELDLINQGQDLSYKFDP